jgi:predicted nuclease of predicted toxin-antitoxin system
MEIERIRGGRGNLDEVRATTRFLLDNNTDLAVLLRHFDGIGVSTDELPASLKRRSDEEVLAYAWQRDRVLLTHDDDFLDVRRHPWETNPGVVVMPGGSGDVARYLRTIGNMLALIIKPYRRLWISTYTHIQASGSIVVKGVNATTKVEIAPWTLRFDEDARPYQWVDEEVELLQ